jgi:hypothetical protein
MVGYITAVIDKLTVARRGKLGAGSSLHRMTQGDSLQRFQLGTTILDEPSFESL